MKRRTLMNKNADSFLVKDTAQDYHTKFGYFKKSDLVKKSGAILESNKGKKFSVFDASFLDQLSKIKRGAQIIPLKDAGFILAETGINNDAVVVDAGAGSGALACFLAHIAKKVTTYEIREDFAKIVQHNIDYFGLKNIELKLKNIYDGIDEKNVDVVTLDLPEPWEVLQPASTALKHGGYLISYSPTIPQVMDFVKAIEDHDDLVFIKTSEITEREWDVNGRKVRPKSQTIGHSGFMTVVRRL